MTGRRCAVNSLCEWLTSVQVSRTKKNAIHASQATVQPSNFQADQLTIPASGLESEPGRGQSSHRTGRQRRPELPALSAPRLKRIQAKVGHRDVRVHLLVDRHQQVVDLIRSL